MNEDPFKNMEPLDLNTLIDPDNVMDKWVLENMNPVAILELDFPVMQELDNMDMKDLDFQELDIDFEDNLT